MTEPQRLLRAYDGYRAAGQPCALATVVEVLGSAYRRPGARMLVTESGEVWQQLIQVAVLDANSPLYQVKAADVEVVSERPLAAEDQPWQGRKLRRPDAARHAERRGGQRHGQLRRELRGGAALMEQTMRDPHRAHYTNASLVDYHVCVNADIPAMTVKFIDEKGPTSTQWA